MVDKTASPDGLVGQLLDGRYVVRDRIARGGMATVYEATDLRLDRRVALKVMPEALADDDTFTQRFVREARAAARLTHPNVVAVYDQGEDNGLLFLAMEFVPGRHTLRDVIRAEAPLAPTRALSITEEILKALAAAHDAGIVHRDVKPENVLIDPRGQIKVADFGLARAISSATAATATGGVLMGTVSYLPPELVVDGSADARADVYALGVLLFELLTGSKPHIGETPIQIAYKHVHDDVPAPSTFVGTDAVPPYLDAFVARATSRDRDHRPADAHVMLQQLRRVRQALDSGVIDDQELTDDLTPTLPVGSSTPAASAEGVAGIAAAVGAGSAADEVFDVLAFDDFAASTERTLMVGETRAPVRPLPTPGQPPIGPPAAQPRDFGPPRDDGQPPAAYQRSRRRGWIAFFVVLLLAAGAALSGWWFAIGRFQPTPNVVDMSQSAAESKIEQAGLSFKIDDTAYSETVEPGHVISTEPGPGDDVLKDGTVSAVVSKGPERHAVPKLDAMSESEAIDAITEASLAVGETTRQWSETIAKGELISYAPKAGTSLKRDAEVTLVVSKGPKPIKISNYEGDSADSAESELKSAGFEVKIKERYDDDVDSGVVISQKPGKGVGYKGDTITLTVSKGPPVAEVPDVTGAGVDAATQKLKDAGFKVEVVNADLYIGLGYIVSQNPEAGTMAAIGSTVTISQV